MYASTSLNRFKSLILIVIVALILLIIIPISLWNTNLFLFYMDILAPLVGLFASWFLIYTAWWSYKTREDTFKPWLILSMAMVFYSIASFFYFVFEDYSRIISPLSIADIFYIGAYPLLVLGILLFMKKPFKIKYKSLLDAVIIMISAFFIVWFLFVWPTVGPSQPDTLSDIIAIFYLFLDLIVLFAVLTLLFNENRKISELPLILFTLGMFLQILGDMIYAYHAINPILIYKWLFTVLYASNSIFIIIAVICFLKDINVDLRYLIDSYRESRAQNDLISYLPLILVIFTYGLLIITIPDKALIWGVGIVVVLVIIRQIISLNEIKKAQKTLKRNKELISKREEQLTFITSNMMDLITESDEDGIYKYVSPSSLQLIGQSPENLLGKSLYEFIHPDDLEEVTNSLKKSVESHLGVRLQYRSKNSEGKYIWLETIGKPVFKDNKIKRFIYSSRDISEQKEAEEFVKSSLIEKEALLREIHHRVNNNLQIIISLLNLQSKNVVNDEDYELFINSQNRVRSMAMIHEKLYQSDNLSSINFSDYLKTFLNSLIYSYSNLSHIDLELDIEEIELNIETSVPCGLIINELVSNSLKHAFPQGRKGKIMVKMYPDNDEYVLIVKDNGVGHIKEHDLENGTTLGLSLVDSLVDQLDGNIEILEEEGTVYKITFPELKYEKRI
ncbi:MAG: PAS domain S-box protein [Methanobacterium sp.]|uniref:histidine kinase dimerization/phosphoacceptor domain -containing protein n=1 Tax=Methanobacterium sp. TaxID=2164 RepID=UPI003D658421|nr:PAS domain S-box protein [Methanobacterium sp.]